QKLLILRDEQVRRYDRAIWVDSDILFNPDAPPMTDGVPPDRIGAVDLFATPSTTEHRLILRRMHRYWTSASVPFRESADPREYYERVGLPPAFDALVSDGLMVLTPAEHQDLLESTYERYEDRGPGW